MLIIKAYQISLHLHYLPRLTDSYWYYSNALDENVLNKVDTTYMLWMKMFSAKFGTTQMLWMKMFLTKFGTTQMLWMKMFSTKFDTS